MYILRAYDRAGDVGYYTGKAGLEWVSNKAEKAFAYENIDGALRKSRIFNRMTPIHNMSFRVEAK